MLLFIDAYDLWFQKLSAREILDRFDAFGTDIVIGAEKNCWPGDKYCDLFPHHDDLFEKYEHARVSAKKPKEAKESTRTYPAFVNTGAMLCKRDACLEWFKYSSEFSAKSLTAKANDQVTNTF